MGLRFEKAGILTTVQDLGRVGHRRFGVNPNGVMDAAAARISNLLVGNIETSAVLEMHFPAPQIFFEKDAVISICGADLEPHIDDEIVRNWSPIFARKGSVLKFASPAFGTRAYLAVCGGLVIDEWLGSSSTNLAANIGGLEGRKIANGDRIEIDGEVSLESVIPHGGPSPSLVPRYSKFPTVRVVAGPEYELLTSESKAKLFAEDLSILAASDRMGFRLKGETLQLAEPIEIVSSAVTFGTIQLLPDGQLIVLMADHQTSGGYPRVANVVSRDQPLLAQLGPNDKVAFHLIENSEAEALAVELERELSFFRVGCKFQAKSWQKA